MSRKRSPEYDYICKRCQAACDAQGTKHMSGGTWHRRIKRGLGASVSTTCGQTPDPILRSDWEKEQAEFVKAAHEAVRGRVGTHRKERPDAEGSAEGDDTGTTQANP